MNQADSAPEKEFGLPELIAIGVGGMIGGGIFSVLGLAVNVSGHAAPLAFFVGSVIALVAGYSYVKLALTYRGDGASFTYLERAFPRQPAIAGIAGWTVVVGYIGTLALYSFTFGAYSAHLFGAADSPILRRLLSLAALLLFMLVNLRGAAQVGKAEDVVVYTKVLLLAVLAAVGFTTVETQRMSPIFDNGIPAVFLGGALIFVAFEGFQLITNAVAETRHPERNIPRAIYGSIGVTSLIYVAIAWVAVGNLSADGLRGANEYALAVVADPIMGRAGVVLVDIAAMLATSSAINATLFGAARLSSEMSSESLAPRVFSVRNRTRVPAFATASIALLAVLLTLLGSLEMIASFSSLTFLLVSVGVCVANLKLRSVTRSKTMPILLGLGLLVTTIVLLIIYMAQNETSALIATAVIYGVTAIAHMAFERVRGRAQTKH